ncbi:unnamed protein product [Rotaria magnacalcarata]|uniref:Cyclic nucleotide-binding domain-containing protein n=1 Tax=Rotaria magnacalcarata TaxID=392030 RepID=A0A819GFX9_9BILA|nr:unnamed protein product [Rotaria magnacalcarata]CAF1304982.1 unnamed protein product [Rotaria magnacalcarata]CAF2037756.1 unnamed protein product [Rotaria magnacalcarata]CAF2124423.1 unnamed protein product [Rotaria magnacalcarata]CAF2127311.1 unnamed protein product [Rotaria magnacalcarata]
MSQRSSSGSIINNQEFEQMNQYESLNNEKFNIENDLIVLSDQSNMIEDSIENNNNRNLSIVSNERFRNSLADKNKTCQNHNMETIKSEKDLNDNRSDNICDISSSSSLRKDIARSYFSSLVVLPDVSSNKEKTLSNKRLFKSYSSLNNLSTVKNSKRKLLTQKCFPLDKKTNDNSIEKKGISFKNLSSHQSIDIIKEHCPNQYLYENNHSNLFKFNQQQIQTATTKIKLSLPLLTAGLNKRRRYENKNDANQNTVQGEFILPTNPPITVTIQPQSTINELIQKDNSLHDDQIYSPDHVHIINKKRSSLDTSLKGTSTIVNYFMDLLKPSDNKLAMKLFGSRKGVLKERLRQQRSGHCIIHPCSNFRFYWDLVMLILLITNVIVLPVAIAFFSEDINSARWIIFNVVSDALFLFDIVVNFRTGVLRNDYIDEIILEPRLIAMHYIKTWFVVDLLSSLPIDYLFLFFDTGDHSGGYSIARTGRAIKVLRLVKLLSLLRLLRLSRLVRYIHQWEEFLSIASMVMRILNLIALIILLAHWNGCLQFMIPMFQNFPSDCWVALNGLQQAPWTEQYTVALFKALSHMLCIGYGRYPPQSYVDMWLTMLSMVIGAMCYAVTIGHVSALVQSFDTSRRLYNEKFKQVEEYMAWRKLPREMRNRISDYYEHRYQGKIFHEDSILHELSERLRLDVINYNCRSLVSSVPFFSNADPNFVSDVVTQLHFEVFQPGDQIICEGTIGNKMYFIQEGVVDIIKSDGQVLTTLSDGSYFGEICLLTRAKRTAGVRCVTYCNLYSLDSSQFERVLESYPLMRRTMESVAAERLNKLGKNPSIISTRHDLKRDAAVLKDIIDRATPQPSSDESSESDSSSVCSNQNRKVDFKSSLSHLHDEFKKSFIKNPLNSSRRKFSHEEKKFKNYSRNYLSAPKSNSIENQIKKSLSIPFSTLH